MTVAAAEAIFKNDSKPSIQDSYFTRVKGEVKESSTQSIKTNYTTDPPLSLTTPFYLSETPVRCFLVAERTIVFLYFLLLLVFTIGVL
jgi:hypothetical protein